MVTIALSPLDQERFHFPVAWATDVSADQIEDILAFCHDNRVRLLIARSPAEDIYTAQAVEDAGFRLMDTLVYWTRDLTHTPIPPDTNAIPIRPVRQDEVDAVKTVARESFKSYFGHYHADPRLDRAVCDEIYISWAERSVLMREVADEVLVADLDGTVIGFVALRLTNPTEGQPMLSGVSPSVRGRGIFRSFMTQTMVWSAAQGADHVTVSTQLINIASQKAWARLGFEFSRAYYTFHKWFDDV